LTITILRNSGLKNTKVKRVTTLEGADVADANIDPDFYGKVLADQLYGIYLLNTVLPNR
jgi:hypothetical protein